MRASYALRGKVWRSPGAAGWHFVTLPVAKAHEIKATFGRGNGWGSVRVEATVGATTWATSIFPDAKSASYLLPIKREVREKEALAEGANVEYRLRIER